MHNKVFILTAIEYYTKLAEAEAYVHVKASTMVKFIQKNIIVRFWILKVFITKNGLQFISQQMEYLCTKYGIELHHSTPYYPQANGQVEAAKKALLKIIKKTVETANGNWLDHLVETLQQNMRKYTRNGLQWPMTSM